MMLRDESVCTAKSGLRQPQKQGEGGRKTETEGKRG